MQVLNPYLKTVLVLQQDVPVILRLYLGQEAQNYSQTQTIPLHTLPHVTVRFVKYS